jgi:hypothetical protein
MEDDIVRAERARRGSPYLNTEQAAHYLKLSVRSLKRLRAARQGPVPRRHARMVLYHIDDLIAWSRARAE